MSDMFKFLLAVIGVSMGYFYLANSIYQFKAIVKASEGRRYLRILLCNLPLILGMAMLIIGMNTVNAVLVMSHIAFNMAIYDIAMHIISRKHPERIRPELTMAIGIFITTVYLSYGYVADHHIWETKYDFTTNKDIEDLRIVQFSDSHIGASFDGEGFAEIVERMKSYNPDLVVITGDYLDGATTEEDLVRSCQALGTIQAKYGVFYVYGNHEKTVYDSRFRKTSTEDMIREFEKNNIHILEDDIVLLDNQVYVIGRYDRSLNDTLVKPRKEMSQLVEGLDMEKYSIVLEHQPCDYISQMEAKVDLVLSGHTHGGQMLPVPWIYTFVSDNYMVYGHEKLGQTDFVVTSGLSSWRMIFKTGCKSEFVVIDVHGNKEDTVQ